MRPAYGAEETGICGHEVTIVVDVANVMGSRPDGWWRDRAGAAVRLHDQIARLAASGRAILLASAAPAGAAEGLAGSAEGQADATDGPAEAADGQAETADGAVVPGFVLVLEGAARAAIPRLPKPGPGAAGPPKPGEVRVAEARGSGDDEIVAVVRELPGRRVVVTADRELRARCAAVGAEILGPGWLLGQLREQ
jgi:8-oxo-dGTP diphosphatase